MKKLSRRILCIAPALIEGEAIASSLPLGYYALRSPIILLNFEATSNANHSIPFIVTPHN